MQAAGPSRVVAGVLESQEALGRAVAQAFAAYLRRPLDAGGWLSWMPQALASADPMETVAVGVLISDEYYRTVGALAVR